MYKLELSEIFTCQLDSEAYAFLAQYRILVQWWKTKINETHHSYSELRDNFYPQWKQDWKNYHSQHAQTSSLTAYNMSKFSKQVSAKAEEMWRSFAVISPNVAKIDEDKKLVFPTNLTKKAQVRLIPKDPAQQVLLNQIQNEYWKIGQIFLTPKWCTIPITRYIYLTSDEKEDAIIQELLK